MKILFLAPQPFFQARGTPINVRNVLRVLGGSGRKVDLLTYHIGEDVDIENVNILRIPPVPLVRSVAVGPSFAKIPLDIAMFFKAVFIFSKGRYDCVHAVEESVFIAFFLKKFFGTPYIYDMDSSISDQLRYSGKLKAGFLLRAVERFERAAAENAAAVLTVCSALTEKARSLAPGVAIFQVEDCPLEVDKRPSSATRTSLGIKKDDTVFMYTGNLAPYQGCGMLVKSFSHVVRQFPAAQLVIAGGEAHQIDALKSQAGRSGIEWAVKFAGKVPMEEIPSLIQEADILVSPRMEGTNTPLKIYDYLASGKPIVATDLPMHTQVLGPGAAVLAPPEPKGFAEGMLKLLRSPSMRSRLARSGKKLVKEKYGFPVFSRKISDFYGFVEQNIAEERRES